MKFLKVFLISLFALPTAWANVDANIKYSSNYLMPAYVHFKADGSLYSVKAQINVPLYNIKFQASGKQGIKQFEMQSYQDVRNDKVYAKANIQAGNIEYGKVKSGLKTETLALPTFDLFTVALQLSYYEKLPVNFQITNGKKLYPMENVFVRSSERKIKVGKEEVVEITYQFKTGEKSFVVKKYQGEKFPRYISYDKDGDHYELTFSGFVK
ncbi:putative outer membrane protein [Canicola haemoglobinophilus]|uniref:Outer membrane protein n=1 Tax=Canicola haemoglobinophilus TaxID=733 RepID=A0AB38H7N0_9PAST|nr:hypothetical protein [Canicola haemoglobinophilus]STO55405.1 putative outer membrane protein [Canicola haemoglobinophilus]STO67733.1 putative outer membrane protein [Canicola haemoglobinophilus]